MAFYVVAEPAAEFRAWMARMAEPAGPAEGRAARGETVFLSNTCVGCHAVRGTEADEAVGPDLTHLADRETLFAGAIANTRAGLARVVTDPQAIKPGVIMPPTSLDDDDLDALLDYLQQLD